MASNFRVCIFPVIHSLKIGDKVRLRVCTDFINNKSEPSKQTSTITVFSLQGSELMVDNYNGWFTPDYIAVIIKYKPGNFKSSNAAILNSKFKGCFDRCKMIKHTHLKYVLIVWSLICQNQAHKRDLKFTID